MAAGSCSLPLVPMRFSVSGYVILIVVITAGYALFQAANNTAVMADIRPDQRGVISGILNLSRNFGANRRRIHYGCCVCSWIGGGQHHDGKS